MRIRNKIAQGDINIFSHFNIRCWWLSPFFDIFPTKSVGLVTFPTEKNIFSFVFSMSIFFLNDCSLAYIRKCDFWWRFGAKNVIIVRAVIKLLTDLADFL